MLTDRQTEIEIHTDRKTNAGKPPNTFTSSFVQRRFYSSYHECLKCLNIELRRLHTYFFWCFKIVFGLVYVNLDDVFVFSPCQYTREHKFKLYERQTINCVRANFFSERVINCWNSLSHTVDFSFFSKFKRTVKSVDFTDFLNVNVHYLSFM